MFHTPTVFWATLVSSRGLLATTGTASVQHGHGGHHGGHGHGHYHGGHNQHSSFGFYGYAYPRTYSGYGYGYLYYGGATYYAPQYYVRSAQAVVNYPPPATVESAGNVARIEARLPVADAQVWIEGREMTSSGLNRVYESPELTPGKSYAYTLKATWTQEGRRLRRNGRSA